MDAIHLLHENLATTVMLFFLAVGLWGMFEFARGGAIGGNIAGAFVIGQVLAVVQSLFGAALYLFTDDRPGMIHVLYGIMACISLPFAWSYMRDKAPRPGLLMYSLISLFIFGLAIRGMSTA
jgi:hypothetical protein